MFSSEYMRQQMEERRKIQKIFEDLMMRRGGFSIAPKKTQEEIEQMYHDVKKEHKNEI